MSNIGGKRSELEVLKGKSFRWDYHVGTRQISVKLSALPASNLHFCDFLFLKRWVEAFRDNLKRAMQADL